MHKLSFIMAFCSSFTSVLLVYFPLLFWNTRVIHSYTLPTRNSDDLRKDSTLLNLLGVAENLIRITKDYSKSETSLNVEPVHPMDCAEIQQRNISSKSGIHNIWPRSRVMEGPVAVYCDMEDDGGAWTIIQRRGDFDSGKDYFYRDWASYKKGFGDLLKDFWLGNDIIFALTNERSNSVKFNLEDWEGNATYAYYEDFWIDNEDYNYTLHVSGYRGNAGDSFSFTNGNQFSTKDRDNDKHSTSCAVVYKGAWWYAACHSSNLNGFYLKGAHESFADGVDWSAFRGYNYSLKNTIIKIRPKNFRKDLFSKITPQ